MGRAFGRIQVVDREGYSSDRNRELWRTCDHLNGLLFIGASRDEKFRDFTIKNGKVLWEYQFPAGGYATPILYVVNGKQYVVIAAGGGKMGTKSGNSYLAFSLPDIKK
jgi:quinoprotein glucose dehydrogenase